MLHDLLFVLVLAGLVAGCLVVFVSVRNMRRDRERIRTMLAASNIELPKPGRVAINYHRDTEYRYQYGVAGRSEIAKFRLGIAHDNHARVTIRRERGIDRLCKRLGIVAEVQTRVRTFDRRYYIDCAQPAYAEALLADADKREAVEAIMASGFNTIICDDDSIVAEVSKPTADTTSFRPLSDTVESLWVLAQGQPRIPEHLGSDRAAGWLRRLQFVYTLLALMCALAFGAVFMGLDAYRPLDIAQLFARSLLFSLPVLLLIAGLLVMLLRGESSSHIHVAVALILALGAIIFGGYGGLLIANALGDQPPADTIEATVIGKRMTTTRGGRNYRATVESWRPGRPEEQLRIPADAYERLKVGHSRLAVTIKPGRFGFPWLAGPLTVVQDPPLDRLP